MGEEFSKDLCTTQLQSWDRQLLYGRNFGLRSNQCEMYVSRGVTDSQVDNSRIGILGGITEVGQNK